MAEKTNLNSPLIAKSFRVLTVVTIKTSTP